MNDLHRTTSLRFAIASSLLVASAACETKDIRSADSAFASVGSDSARAAVGDGSSTGSADVPSVGGDTTVEYYTAAQLAHVGDSLSRGPSTGHVLRAHPTYQYLQIRRHRSGMPEVHDRWTDVTVVQAGRGTLLSGGRVSGSHVETPGEHRGGTITGGTSRPVGAGDLMIIPAGVPHQYMLAAGDSLRYLTVKVRGGDGAAVALPTAGRVNTGFVKR